MSSKKPVGLFTHQQVKEKKEIKVRKLTCQKQSRLYSPSMKVSTSERTFENTSSDLHEDKDRCLNSVNKQVHLKSKHIFEAKDITGLESVKVSDTSINIPGKTETTASSVAKRASLEKNEQAIFTRSFLSGVGNSSTKRQGTMGSLVCAQSQPEDQLGESQEGIKKKKLKTSNDTNKFKQPHIPSEKQRGSDNSKKFTQTTLRHYEIRTRAAQRTEWEKKEKAAHHKQLVDKDIENYRKGYPGKKDNPHLNDNLRFYKGQIMSVPRGAYIDDIHDHWWGNYDLLESHHGYIQWLFPIRESGMNLQAQPLQLHEAEAIQADVKALNRVLRSYELMLDFYGMELVNERTGRVKRSENWRERFDNLNRSSHNYLRITRILKCLGELGYEHLKKGFVQFVLEEALVHGTLQSVYASCRDYWIGTIKDGQDREDLYRFTDEHGRESGVKD